jgi:hypothetical protein
MQSPPYAKATSGHIGLLREPGSPSAVQVPPHPNSHICDFLLEPGSGPCLGTGKDPHSNLPWQVTLASWDYQDKVQHWVTKVRGHDHSGLAPSARTREPDPSLSLDHGSLRLSCLPCAFFGSHFPSHKDTHHIGLGPTLTLLNKAT